MHALSAWVLDELCACKCTQVCWPVNTVIQTGANYSADLQAEASVLPALGWDVSNGTLQLFTTDNISTNLPISAVVRLPLCMLMCGRLHACNYLSRSSTALCRDLAGTRPIQEPASAEHAQPRPATDRSVAEPTSMSDLRRSSLVCKLTPAYGAKLSH